MKNEFKNFLNEIDDKSADDDQTYQDFDELETYMGKFIEKLVSKVAIKNEVAKFAKKKNWDKNYLNKVIQTWRDSLDDNLSDDSSGAAGFWTSLAVLDLLKK